MEKNGGEGDFFALLASQLIHPKTEKIYQRVKKTPELFKAVGDIKMAHTILSPLYTVCTLYMGKSLLFQQAKTGLFFPRIEVETGQKNTKNFKHLSQMSPL